MIHEYKALKGSSSDSGDEEDAASSRMKATRDPLYLDGENWMQENCMNDTKLLNQNVAKYNGDPQYSKDENNWNLGFPTTVFYIIGSEFCERFSYFGLRAVLVLYFSSELLMSEDKSTSLFHVWAALCYFTPVLGAVIADSYLGRFRTIFYLSLVFLLGNVVLSGASTRPLVRSIEAKTLASVMGLVLIAFGTGGIKSSVAAFGGDQFQLPEQEKQISKFFSIFYFSINAGALLSTFVTPILREDVKCFGSDHCFPLAFGVPSVLMVLALGLLLLGKPRYKIIPPEGNVISEVVRCVTFASYQKIKSLWVNQTKIDPVSKKSIEPRHWVDFASQRFSPTIIQDVKTLLSLFLLYVPLPIFWALYDQQGSRWTIQATKMSGQTWWYTIKPDQMQVLNPLLIMVLIPLFESVVYPFLSTFNVLKKPLHRMFFGGLLASLAFVLSGIVQIAIENRSVDRLPAGKLAMRVLNGCSCPVRLEDPLNEVLEPHDMMMKTFDADSFWDSLVNPTDTVLVEIKGQEVSQSTLGCQSTPQTTSVKVKLQRGRQEILLVVSSYFGQLSFIQIPEEEDQQRQQQQQQHKHISHQEDREVLRIVDSTDLLRLSPLELKNEEKTYKFLSKYYSKGISVSNSQHLQSGEYDIVVPDLSETRNPPKILGTFTPTSHVSGILFIYERRKTTQEEKDEEECDRLTKELIISMPSIHMLWLLPQYVVLSTAEVMFSITGLQYSFTQAPSRMKSVVQAVWLLTTAFGNVFVVLVAEISLFKYQSLEFFMFAGLMLVDMLVFLWLATKYQSNPEATERGRDFESTEGLRELLADEEIVLHDLGIVKNIEAKNVDSEPRIDSELSNEFYVMNNKEKQK